MAGNCTFIESNGGGRVCQACGKPAPGQGRVYRRCVSLAGVAAADKRPCAFLGPAVGLLPCATCRGNVNLKTYRCLAGRGEITLSECPCQDYVPLAPPEPPAGGGRGRILLRFSHGLGDGIQFTSILRHLRAMYPGLGIALATEGWKATGFVEAGLCDAVYEPGQEPPLREFDDVRTLYFGEPTECYADSPSTKVEKCLREAFGIVPQRNLAGYVLHVPDAARERVARELPGEYVLLHYSGHSSRPLKDLGENAVQAAVDAIARQGLRAVVLDLDRRSRLRGAELLRREHAVFAGGCDLGTLAALGDASKLNIGIDSGPGKAFAALAPPSLICWRGLHPLHYQAPGHSIHLVPRRHPEHVCEANRWAGLEYFRRHYRYREMQGNLRDELPAAIAAVLEGRGESLLAPQEEVGSRQSPVGSRQPQILPTASCLLPTSSSPSPLFVFSHHGDYGDVIYSLMSVKHLCDQVGGRCAFYLCPDPGTRAEMTAERAEALLPLLRDQPYIAEAGWRPAAVGVAIDTAHRRFGLPGLNLADQYTRYLQLPPSREHGAWLSLSPALGDPVALADVVFARSARYRNPRFAWPAIYRRFGQRAVFIGLPEEHADFEAKIGRVAYAQTSTLLDAARIIAGCRLFVGNMSCPRAIAEGLKVPVCVEERLDGEPDTRFPRPEAWYNIPPPEHFLR